MSSTVRVTDRIRLDGAAKYQRNFEGDFNANRLMVEYNYTELALDNTNKYTPYLDTSSTVALGANGLLLTTAATDTKTCTQSQGGVYWYPNTMQPAVEFRFKSDVIINVAIFAGLSDAVSEASGLLPFGISTATLTDTADNGAGFLFDTRQTLSYFNVVNSNGGTEAFTQLDSTHVPVADTWLVLRVEIDSSGNAIYYWNGSPVAYKASAVAAATPLVPFFGIRNNTASAHVATLRTVRVWGDNA